MTNKNQFISTFKLPIANKHSDKVVTYGKWILYKKLHDHLITWSREVRWQMKSELSPHLLRPRLPNLTRWSFMIRSHRLLNHVKLWSCYLMKLQGKQKTLHLFLQLGRMVDYDIKPLATKSHGPSIVWTVEVILKVKSLYLQFQGKRPPTTESYAPLIR